jgi:6-phosphogluconolactonase
MKLFDNRIDFEKAVTNDLMEDLDACRRDTSDVHVLLSGGSTPGPIYHQLNKVYPHLSELKIGLVDERFVPTYDVKSNELLLRTCFDSPLFKTDNIIGMVQDSMNKEKNLELARKVYAPFIERTDIVILGMGTDGHTASIFPNDPQSENALNTSDCNLFNTLSPQFPVNRITCSFALLMRARFIYLLISGKEKRDLLLSNDSSIPIYRFLQERKDLKLYYLDHD